jgi:hypothetical protein
LPKATYLNNIITKGLQVVYISIKNINKPTQYTHLATNWELAEDENFTKMVTSSMNDHTNVTSIIFHKELIHQKTYYVRVRRLFNFGWSEKSSFHKFVSKTDNRINLTLPTPTTIVTPTVSIKYDQHSTPHTHFNIFGSEFTSATSDVEHVATDYIIVNENDETVWTSFNNERELTKLRLDNMFLTQNMFYTIYVIYRGSNNSVSNPGSLTIYVSNDKRLQLHKMIGYIDNTKDFTMVMETTSGTVSKVEYWLMGEDDEVVTHDVVNDYVININSQYFEDTTKYLLIVKLNDVDEKTSFLLLTTNPDVEEITNNLNVPDEGDFPLEFPHLFTNYGY